MASFKVNISDPKTGRTIKTELTDQKAELLIGKKIGDTVKGEVFDMPGYEMLITGGSDFAGFPMVPNIQGAMRKRILTCYGIGMRIRAKGFRRRKTVVGNTISDSISQINLKIIKYGRKPLFDNTDNSKVNEETTQKESKQESEQESKQFSQAQQSQG